MARLVPNYGVERNGWEEGDSLHDLTRPSYQKDAACRDISNPEIFFPSAGDTESLKAAKALCNICPVIAECLEYALGNNERYGIWGGKSTRERLLILRAKRMLEAGEA
jgi:WhiB family redox-sensing transcriptional regulator